MYARVGTYLGAKELLQFFPDLRPIPGPEVRYTTYHQGDIQEIYYPKLRGVFPSDRWAHCFLSAIWHNGHIEPHQDATLPPGVQRFHLVLQTNADCWFLHDGTWQQLEETGIYTMDPTLVHASINWGHPPRVLLVVDAKLEE